jgi:RHS repeat-associated protein
MRGRLVGLTIHFFHTDRNGAPTQLTDSLGRTIWRASYRAWGCNRCTPGEELAHQPLRFQGQYCDEETGLHYNQHRYYDPDAGRFLTQDPIGLSGGINPYRYARNPIGWSDPLGLQGVNLNLAGEIYQAWASTFVHSQNYFSILAHGNPSGLTGTAIGDPISPHELAQRIRQTPGYRNDQTVALLACHSGSERNLSNPQNSSYAQELADELQQPVIAPNGVINSGSYNGVGFVYPEGNAQWLIFNPEPYVLMVL